MQTGDIMYVIKRDTTPQVVSFDKILIRVQKLANESDININCFEIVKNVIEQLHDNISTSKIDEITAEYCISLVTTHLNYGILASRIAISNLHKNTKELFSDITQDLYNNIYSNKNEVGNIYTSPIVNETYYNYVQANKDVLNGFIIHDNDYSFDYFGFKTLEKNYLLKSNGIIIERPQHLLLRVATCIHMGDLDKIKETYNLMSLKYFTHATPTLFNAGTLAQQLSSCYLIAMEEDSVDGIYNTLNDCANISKWSGGIGLHIHNIRAKQSIINGTNGVSSGIVPMLQVFNYTARFINQGGKRNGSIAIYIEPWHADIEQFLEMKKNHGDEESKARDLFYALWISDLFMERVKTNSMWSLFSPDKCKGLCDVYGEEFNTLYTSYEDKKMYKSQINARDLWLKIIDSQMETGTPYLLYKDAVNKKSNQKNLGTIKSSNLCCEIMEYSDDKETAVCNLASIGLPTFINKTTNEFDYNKLHEVVQIIVVNLNNIIDINFYPTDKTLRSNMLHRPIGIGIQGLADVFIILGIPFESDQAKHINKQIFETIYHASLTQSNIISINRTKVMNDIHNAVSLNYPLWETTIHNDDMYKKVPFNLFEFVENPNNIRPNYAELIKLSISTKGSYSSFCGSPLSKGQLQMDLWDYEQSNDRYDWDLLRSSIIKHGVRNSLLVAPMPTASTSQILGFNECFEPITSNIYTRRTLAGEFVILNKYLMKELIDLNIWNNDTKENIIKNKGSVQYIPNLPEHIKEKYKIVWEMKMKNIIDMSVDRGRYICQSQSLNLWVEDPNYNNLTSMHFYAWNQGLKTGMYYLRRKAKHQAQQFTIEPTMEKKEENDDESICDMCSG
jgi:ribonucleotide reductase alpha subunit